MLGKPSLGGGGRPYSALTREEKNVRIARVMASRRKNPKSHKEASWTHLKRLRVEVLGAYGGKCACCMESRIEFLVLDHVENDGKAHRAAVRGGSKGMYIWARRNGYPDNLQVLCHNCNMSKAFYGYCPCSIGQKLYGVS